MKSVQVNSICIVQIHQNTFCIEVLFGIEKKKQQPQKNTMSRGVEESNTQVTGRKILKKKKKIAAFCLSHTQISKSIKSMSCQTGC